MWIHLYEEVQPVLSGRQEALKFGVLESSELARSADPIARGRASTLLRNSWSEGPAGFLGSTGGRASLPWEHTKSLLVETPCKASEADSDCNVLHQMTTVLKNTFSLLFQVVVLKF